jgi:hypothetical protein
MDLREASTGAVGAELSPGRCSSGGLGGRCLGRLWHPDRTRVGWTLGAMSWREQPFRASSVPRGQVKAQGKHMRELPKRRADQ